MNPSQDSGDYSRLWQIIHKHWFAGSLAFISVFTVGAIATSLRQDVYQAEARLKFNSSDPAPTVAQESREQTSREISAVPITDSLVAQEQETLRSLSLIEQTLADPQLQLLDATGNPLEAREIISKLQVSALPASNIIQVAYTSENSQQAVTIVDALIQNYLQARRAKEREEFLAQRNSLETQLSELTQSIRQTESAIRKLQTAHDFVALGEQTKILLQSEQELIQEINQIKSQLAKGQSQANYWRQQLESISSEIDNETEDQSNKLWQQRLNQNSIQLEANNLGLQQQLVSLEQSLADYQAKIQQIPQVEAQLSQLTRKAKEEQSTYDILWQQLENLKLNSPTNLSTVKVSADGLITAKKIDARPLGYISSSVIALLSAIGVVAWRIVQDKSIATIAEAKAIYGYDWLGIIPNIEQVTPLSLSATKINSDRPIPQVIVKDYPSVSGSEAYWMLQSNLKFLSSEQAVKTITITSSAIQEGKSTVAANLATAMAQVGQQVLLIDANLHEPIQHLIWDTYNDVGLSNVVAEQLNPRTAVKQIMSNLDLLTAGTGLSSPATLLDSQRMRMLMDYWSEQYDYVLLDTPSLGVAADATLISRLTDGILLVVRPGFIERSQASFVREILVQPGINLLGVVFNGVASPFKANRVLTSQSQLQQHRPLEKINAAQDRLWENLTAIIPEVSKNQLPNNLNEQELLLAPLEQLEATVHALQQDLGELTILVKEQEEELFNQRQKVKQLQRQANIATENEYFYLEHQLNQEQEKKRMLDRTLVGQRRNLSKRRQILIKYQEILASRKYSDAQSTSKV